MTIGNRWESKFLYQIIRDWSFPHPVLYTLLLLFISTCSSIWYIDGFTAILQSFMDRHRISWVETYYWPILAPISLLSMFLLCLTAHFSRTSRSQCCYHCTWPWLDDQLSYMGHNIMPIFPIKFFQEQKTLNFWRILILSDTVEAYSAYCLAQPNSGAV